MKIKPSKYLENRGDVLIVDDHPENLKILEAILKEYGYKVRVATSGEMALKVILARPPELILLDVVMPKMDGFQTCCKIKENSLKLVL